MKTFKKILVTMMMCLMTMVSFGQNNSNFNEMYNVTFYDIAIRDTSSIHGNVLYFVDVMQPVFADTCSQHNGYAPVIGGGWASMKCINSEPVTEKQVSTMLNNYLVKIGVVNEEIEEPCAMSDYWKEKYEQTGNATDLDKFRMWFTKCLEKKY